MATRKRSNREVKNIEDTREYQVLDLYHELGGAGLTANALCYLTRQDWKTVRHNLTRFQDDDENTEAVFGAHYCWDVHAPVFYINNDPYSFRGLDETSEFLKAADKIIDKYPPSKFRGAVNDAGQKELTFHWVGESDYDQAMDNWCGDSECCPEPKEMTVAQMRKENRKIVKQLQSVWR